MKKLTFLATAALLLMTFVISGVPSVRADITPSLQTAEPATDSLEKRVPVPHCCAGW